MAANVLASMLDELMGRDRNLAPSDRKNDTRWDDAEVKIYDIKLYHPYIFISGPNTIYCHVTFYCVF